SSLHEIGWRKRGGATGKGQSACKFPAVSCRGFAGKPEVKNGAQGSATGRGASIVLKYNLEEGTNDLKHWREYRPSPSRPFPRLEGRYSVEKTPPLKPKEGLNGAPDRSTFRG